MRDESNSGAVGILIGLALLLLLLVGGAGFYFLMERQQNLAAMAVERARLAEAQAIRQAELARAEAAVAAPDAADDLQPAAESADAIRTAIESVLREQQEAWNRGDVEAFVDHYWKSDELTFSSGGKTTRGWEETLRNYRARYPTRSEMGRLTFDKLEVTPLGEAAALVLGEWALKRDSEPVSGNFSLVFRKLDGRWVIVHDHTSRSAE